MASCTSPLDGARYSDWRDDNPAQWHISNSGSLHSPDTLLSQAATLDEGTAPGKHDLTADMAAEDYVVLALQRSPAIRASRHAVERLRSRLPQVTALDDPMFQMAPFGEMAQTASGEVTVMTGVSQRLPYPGKLATRGRIAEQDVAMALADLRQTELQVAADTRQAYWSYYFAIRAIETTGESRSLLVQFKEIAEAQYRAGTRTQSDVLRASVELSNLDQELIVLAQRHATARSMLNQLLDRPTNAAIPEPAPIALRDIIGDLDDFLAGAARDNPAVRKVYERIEQARERQSLARLSRRPDLTVSANYNVVADHGLSRAADGEDQWWFGFGINIPLWNAKYDAAEQEALESLMVGVADLSTVRNRIAFQVNDAFLRVEAKRDLIEMFRDVIVPQARQTVEASASGYRAGSVDFLTLIDNWRKLLSFDIMYHRALADMEQAIADLERAIGADVTRQNQEQAQ
ncbi:MAG: TolC family protein [Planctomycetes bacterium]|nr:TolC family protein [Planctomycetota bacterium]